MNPANGFVTAANLNDPNLAKIVAATAAELIGDAGADFSPVNVGGNGITVIGDGGDVTSTWMDTVVDPDTQGTVVGMQVKTKDRDPATLELAEQPGISEAAAEFAFAESLNNDPTDELQLSFFEEASTFGGQTTFANYAARVVAHEAAHTFGLNEAYLNTGGSPIDESPYDIMCAQGKNDPSLKFADVNVDILQAAIGLAPNAVFFLSNALRSFLANFNLSDSTEPFEILTDVATPVLSVNSPNGGFLSGEELDAGQVIVDGLGGQPETLPLTLTNTGSAPLTIRSVSLSDGTTGFSIADPSPAGTTLEIGQSIELDIQLDPTSVGPAADVLNIITDEASPFVLRLSATGPPFDGRAWFSAWSRPRYGSAGSEQCRRSASWIPHHDSGLRHDHKHRGRPFDYQSNYCLSGTGSVYHHRSASGPRSRRSARTPAWSIVSSRRRVQAKLGWFTARDH